MLWRMRRLLFLAIVAVALAIVPAAHGADLTGTWKGSFDFQGQSVPLTFQLTETSGAGAGSVATGSVVTGSVVTGSVVTGSIEGLPTTPTDIHDGKIDGDKLSFWANTDYQGQTYKLEFTGQVAADEISFTFGTDDQSWSSALTARRSSGVAAPLPDVTGTWKGSFDFQGTSVPVTLQLASTGATVTGTVAGMIEGAPEKSVEIQDGKLDGAVLTFWIDTDYQGQSYKIVYKGTLGEGKIDLGFGTDDGSWSSEMTAVKETANKD